MFDNLTPEQMEALAWALDRAYDWFHDVELVEEFPNNFQQTLGALCDEANLRMRELQEDFHMEQSA